MTTETPSHYDHLENRSVSDLLVNINKEDKTVPLAVEKAIPQIEALVMEIVKRMKAGGRLIYIGAGTSGRLGVVDASECPPTYGVPFDLVIGLMAGGDGAIRKAVEFAEDDAEQAWKDIVTYEPNEHDTVIGIAASGRTPYVIGGLQEARKAGLLTGCVVCNEGSAVAQAAEFPVEVVVGPEFVTGSTRMKAGTAQKLVLNMISTSVMIQLGRVKGNKMVDMQLTNIKLQDRAAKMVMSEIDVDRAEAEALLATFGTFERLSMAIAKRKNNSVVPTVLVGYKTTAHPTETVGATMNQTIQHLYTIAQKPERRIIGLMSGTSLDGLDVALCRISGSGSDTQVVVEHFETVTYGEALKAEIRAVFAKKQIDFEQLCLLNPYIGRLHGQMILDCLQMWGVKPQDIDVVASHGQTVYHAPKSQHQRVGFPNATLQIGDGDHVAATTGIITFSDFRQKHVAHGGEGAPLAVYGDYFIFSKKGENRILLNMGGIANFTYLPADGDTRRVFTTDTGPGNTLLDAYARLFLHQAYDIDGQLAAQGNVSPDLLDALKNNAFFDAPFPKTTGPEVFNVDYVKQAQTRSQTSQLADTDLMATLVQFSADTIVDAVQRVLRTQPTNSVAVTNEQPFHVYMSGGGMHNPVLTSAIQSKLPTCLFGRTDELGINGDAKEAVLFAVLANESLAGGTTSFGDRQGVPTVSMGKVSFPT